MANEYLTLAEFAAKLGVSRQGIHKRAVLGQIKTLQIGKHRFVPLAEARLWLGVMVNKRRKLVKTDSPAGKAFLSQTLS